MQKLNTLSARRLAELIRSKEVSCQEVMQAHLDRIAQVNPLLNAIVQPLPPEEAIAQARAADTAVQGQAPLGPLHGIPITIKDGRKVKGFHCTLGPKSPLNGVQTEDSTLVARLRGAGAIVIGITNIPDFSMSYETDNALYGRTNNPYDLNRSPGGSSGGEAAIIAAGASCLGIGADSGGSIRQPAHNCGITGLKPTRGLLPDTGTFPADGLGIFSYVQVQGPMARFVEDLIHALPVLAGPDGRDPNTQAVPFQDPRQVDLRSLRAAFYAGNGVAQPRKDVAETINAAAKALAGDVGNIEEACPEITQDTYTTFEELFFYGGDGGQWLRDRMRKMQVTEVAPPFQAIVDRAAQCNFSVTEMRRRLLALDQFKIAMMAFLRPYDVMICPVATTPAKSYDKALASPEGFGLAYDLTYNLPYNITGWPSVVVRCGTSDEGLPIGVQVIAKPWREDIALAVAKRLEEVFTGWQPSRALPD